MRIKRFLLHTAVVLAVLIVAMLAGASLFIYWGVYNVSALLAGWITDSQHIKPGNRMPFFDIYSGEELRALAAYLQSLK